MPHNLRNPQLPHTPHRSQNGTAKAYLSSKGPLGMVQRSLAAQPTDHTPLEDVFRILENYA